MSDCVLWDGTIRPDGYGQVGIDGKFYLAHRLEWMNWYGPIPDGLVIDHLCRVRACVNVFHMELVTLGENVLRGIGHAAVNKRKTHCGRGHDLSDAWVSKQGKRYCRACDRDRKRLLREAS